MSHAETLASHPQSSKGTLLYLSYTVKWEVSESWWLGSELHRRDSAYETLLEANIRLAMGPSR